LTNKRVSVKGDLADIIVDFICGVDVDEQKLNEVSVSYKTINRRITLRHEQFLSGEIDFNQSHFDALENFM